MVEGHRRTDMPWSLNACASAAMTDSAAFGPVIGKDQGHTFRSESSAGIELGVVTEIAETRLLEVMSCARYPEVSLYLRCDA